MGLIGTLLISKWHAKKSDLSKQEIKTKIIEERKIRKVKGDALSTCSDYKNFTTIE